MRSTLIGLALLLVGCGEKDGHDDTAHEHDDTGHADDSAGGDDSSAGDDTASGDADYYEFQSAFTSGSSVSYGGQVFRNLLIDDMKRYLGGLTARIDNGDYYPAEGEVAADLLFYFEFDSDAYGEVNLGMSTTPALAQQTYNDVSSGKDLVGKIAGNDATGQHADWTTDFVGWPAEGVTTPESLVRAWIAEIDAAAVARVSGDIPLDPEGNPVPHVFVTADGLDYQQLMEKFLRGAVGFSQGADDYLDDDTEGKGLLAAHTAPEDGAYTDLEHAWDEGFGYFGAARSYPNWTDDEIAETPALDVDGDGSIDLLTEVCVGHSVNAGKRDRGAVTAVDFTADAWAGFYNGRKLLAETAGQELTAAQFTELQGYRDQALGAWEASISSSAIHYINDVLQDMGDIGTSDYSFADHTKHWGELKGFALSLQFNPNSPVSDADFAELHELIGAAPVLGDAGAEQQAAYRQSLVDARAIIGEAYGFDAANLGDDNGENGW